MLVQRREISMSNLNHLEFFRRDLLHEMGHYFKVLDTFDCNRQVKSLVFERCDAIVLDLLKNIEPSGSDDMAVSDAYYTVAVISFSIAGRMAADCYFDRDTFVRIENSHFLYYSLDEALINLRPMFGEDGEDEIEPTMETLFKIVKYHMEKVSHLEDGEYQKYMFVAMQACFYMGAIVELSLF